MINIKPQSKFFAFWLLWTISITIGWSLYIFQGINLHASTTASWTDLFFLSANLLFHTFILGVIVGGLQYFLLKPVAVVPAWWIGLMGLGYSLGSVFSLIFSALFVWIFQPEIFSTQGQAKLLFPLALVMILGGGLAGALQIFALRQTFINTLSDGLVWTLMSAFGWGLGFFIMLAVSNSPRVQSGIAGLVIGIITGLALFILSKNRLRQRQTAS